MVHVDETIIKDDIDNNLNSYLNNNINNITLSLSPYINTSHVYKIFYIMNTFMYIYIHKRYERLLFCLQRKI